jgi:hypothetical protein
MPEQHQLALDPHYRSIPDYPWKTITLTCLVRREQVLGWGRNWTGEYFKGPTQVGLYVSLPESVANNYNVLVRYKNLQMVILAGAVPEVRKPRGNSPDLTYYYAWAGR